MSVEDFMRQFYPSMSDEEIAGYVALAAWRTELECRRWVRRHALSRMHSAYRRKRR